MSDRDLLIKIGNRFSKILELIQNGKITIVNRRTRVVALAIHDQIRAELNDIKKDINNLKRGDPYITEQLRKMESLHTFIIHLIEQKDHD